ncbi:GDSL-type esterase/lipase family protein [Pseudaeromonas pectinilytica]
MSNPYYNRQTECNPGELADGLAIEAEFDSLQRAFDKLPAPHRDGGGFEVPVRVGAAVSNDEAAQLAQINALLEGFLSKSGNLAGLAAPGTALSNLGVSTFIKTLLDDADAATARATLGAQASDATLTALAGVTTAADKLPYFTGVDAAAVATLTDFARTLLDDADAATARATLGAQASDATLTALAGVTTAADKLIYATAPDVFTTTSITPFARTLIDDVDAAAMRTTLGIDGLSVNDLRDELEPRISDNESKVFEALRRSYAGAGYTRVSGSFEAGGTVTSATDVLLFGATGIAYSWGGALPKTVPANSTPASSGGVGVNAWTDRSNVSLRDELTKRGGIELLCAKMWAGQTVTIGCYGDSTTDGDNTTGWTANPTSGGKAVGNSDHNLTAPNAWPAKLQEYLREIFKNNNIKTFNAGYSGQRMDNGWALNNYAAAMVNNPYYGIPNICFIGFGLNDITSAGSQIDNHIDKTVKLMFRMVSEGTIPVILTCDAEFRNGQFGDTRDHKEARRELDAAKRALGDKYGVLVVDIGDVLKQWIQNNNDGYIWTKEQPDGLHFGNNGHSLKAQYLASQMLIDTVKFSSGEREIQTWSSEAAYVGNYTTIFKYTNNSQGGNVLYSSAAPIDTDMVTIWVWNTCRNAYLVYQGIENEFIDAAEVYTVAPKVEVKELFGSAVTSKALISPGFKNTSGYQRSDEQFIHSRLKYGLNKVTYRSGDSATLFYGSFKIVDTGNKLTSCNALKETGGISRSFKKDTGMQVVLPQRAYRLSNAVGGFAGERVSISFDISCVKNTGVIFMSGQGYTPSQAAVDANQQTSLLMHRNSTDTLMLLALQTDNTGAVAYTLLGSLASGWTTDAKIGRMELYRSVNNQIIEVYDAFQGGNAVLTLTLPNTGITSRWSGYVGGLYAFTDGAAVDQLVSINRMVINR